MSRLPDKQAEACRQLWVAVFLQALRDTVGRGSASLHKGTRDLLIEQARNWPKSANFDRVASMAGMDPDVARSRFKAAIDNPDLDRRLGEQRAGAMKRAAGQRE